VNGKEDRWRRNEEGGMIRRGKGSGGVKKEGKEDGAMML